MRSSTSSPITDFQAVMPKSARLSVVVAEKPTVRRNGGIYVASKHAVTGLTRSAAIDYAYYGIRINSVNMANTATPMVERAMQLIMAKRKESGGGPSMSMMKTDSLLQAADSRKRDATPAEQVAVMLFLLSDEASNLTGAVYATDGGYTTY